MEQGERGDAERITHTLKGVCGNLGADPLFKASDALEQGLRGGTPMAELAPALQAVQTCLGALVAVLQAEPGVVAGTGVTPVPHAAVLQTDELAYAKEVLQRLRGLLLEDNAQSQSLWEAQSGLLWSLLQDPQGLAEAIADFDFERAMQFLPPP